MTKRLQPNERTELVAGFVPPPVKTFIHQVAEEEKRSISATVKLLLEESPRVRAYLDKTEVAA